MKFPANTVQIMRPEVMEKYIKHNSQEYHIRIAAVMNQEKIWICLFRIHKEGPPESFILYHFENPFKMFKA